MTPATTRGAEYAVSLTPIALDSVRLPSTPSAHLQKTGIITQCIDTYSGGVREPYMERILRRQVKKRDGMHEYINCLLWTFMTGGGCGGELDVLAGCKDITHKHLCSEGRQMRCASKQINSLK